MKPRWMLVAFAIVATCPISASAQYPGMAWSAIGTQGGYNLCVIPQRQLYDPFGVPLGPDVIYCSPAYDCTDFVRHMIPRTTRPSYTASQADSPAVLELQEKVRKLELRVNALEGNSS